MTDPQLAMIARLSRRPGTPPEMRGLLDNPLIEKASKEWASGFIGKLMAADWDFVKEAVGELEEEWEKKLAASNAVAH